MCSTASFCETVGILTFAKHCLRDQEYKIITKAKAQATGQTLRSLSTEASDCVTHPELDLLMSLKVGESPEDLLRSSLTSSERFGTLKVTFFGEWLASVPNSIVPRYVSGSTWL
jgi:hypothetical protein